MQHLDSQMKLLLEFTKNISILRCKHVVIVGRTLIDAFDARGHSHGSGRRVYFGGAWYVADLISRFCSVTFFTDVIPLKRENKTIRFRARALFEGIPEIKYRRLNGDQSIDFRKDSSPLYFREKTFVRDPASDIGASDALIFLDYGGAFGGDRILDKAAQISQAVFFNSQLNSRRSFLPNTETLSESSIWTMNQREGRAYRQLLGIDRITPQLLTPRHKTGCVIETLGPDGARLMTDNHELFCSSPPVVESSNAIGMGDTFLSFFVLGNLLGFSRRDTLHIAVMAGAAKAETFGHERVINESDIARIQERVARQRA